MVEILHEDDDLIALNKPSGLSSQAPPIAGDSLDRRVHAYLAPSDPASAFVGAAHRLDRPVSGVLVWAKHARSARILARQFEQRRVLKEYWGLVEGFPPPSGLWEDWLVRDDTGLGRVQVSQRGTPRAQLARTRFERGRAEAVPAGAAWLILMPETGRMHQLRVQAAARGYPILGDSLYGASREFAAHAIALHARALTFTHPADGKRLTIVAPVPMSWREAGFQAARD
jgi:23S rRNA pseudouridine1911/1915/1917 synthase